MVRVTERDRVMLGWLAGVKVSSMEGVRWRLGGLNGGGPVSLRRAQSWCARMESVGLVARRRVVAGGSYVWVTRVGAGLLGEVGENRVRQDLLRQTTRHEVAVSVVAARYCQAGWDWDRDVASGRGRFEHCADGVAQFGGAIDAVEVELTVKSKLRYEQIFGAMMWRIGQGHITGVRYFCVPHVARAVEKALDGVPRLREKTVVLGVFDELGVWESDVQPLVISDPLFGLL